MPRVYLRLVTLNVRDNEYHNGHLVIEVTLRTYRDNVPIALFMREYSVENSMLLVHRKLLWLMKPVRVCEVDTENPADDRMITTTIEWDLQAKVNQ